MPPSRLNTSIAVINLTVVSYTRPAHGLVFQQPVVECDRAPGNTSFTAELLALQILGEVEQVATDSSKPKVKLMILDTPISRSQSKRIYINPRDL